MFVHPGCLSTQADLGRMKVKVAAGAQPWKGSWDMLVATPFSQLGYNPNPQATVCAGSPCQPENYMALARDAAAAYQLALRYRISGEMAYGAKATQILDAWGNKFTGFTGDSNGELRDGLYGYQLACAGELLRDFPGWDASAFKQMLINAFYPLSSSFLQKHNGACPGNYWANWDLANMATILAIGVFTDRRDIFQEGLDYFYHGAEAGALGNVVHYVHPNGSGQWQESARDQGHTTLGVMLLGVICEIAWNQGIDLYGYAGNRFLAGSEYVSAYNLGNDVPWVAYTHYSGPEPRCNIGVAPQISSASRPTLRVGWDLIYNHYVNRRGLAAPFTQQYAAAVRPEGGGGDYGSTSGGFDSLGFTTLTHTLDPIASGAIPSNLRPFVEGPQITLSWTGSAYATGYRIKRSLTSGGPYTTLATIRTDGSSRWSYYVDPGLTPGVTYYYVVSALTGGMEGPSSQESAGTASGQLFGTVIGTSGSFGSLGATRELAFDGSLRNYFDGPSSVSWAGLDLGSGVSATPTMVKYAPRKYNAGRMVGGKFQGSSTPDFSADVTDLFTITAPPPEDLLTAQAVTSARAFRYLRYVSADGSYGNVAELQFHGSVTGLSAPAAPAAPTGSTMGAPTATLQWGNVAGAERYNLKRSTVSGGPYEIVASGAFTSLVDTGLARSTTYYYVVSAVNKMGESANSAEVPVVIGP
jgi:hypothetical protein